VAIIRTNELREMPREDIEKKLEGLRAEYSKEKALHATGTAPENPGRIKELRRTIARIETILKEKEAKEGNA
jgi:large subunit ribosomal protein L29